VVSTQSTTRYTAKVFFFFFFILHVFFASPVYKINYQPIIEQATRRNPDAQKKRTNVIKPRSSLHQSTSHFGELRDTSYRRKGNGKDAKTTAVKSHPSCSPEKRFLVTSITRCQACRNFRSIRCSSPLSYPEHNARPSISLNFGCQGVDVLGMPRERERRSKQVSSFR
jgi:hypothetical protein